MDRKYHQVLRIAACNSASEAQQFEYKNGRIMLKSKNLCVGLDAKKENRNMQVAMVGRCYGSYFGGWYLIRERSRSKFNVDSKHRTVFKCIVYLLCCVCIYIFFMYLWIKYYKKKLQMAWMFDDVCCFECLLFGVNVRPMPIPPVKNVWVFFLYLYASKTVEEG